MALQELYHSQPQEDQQGVIEFVRAFVALKTDCSKTADGWTVSGIPLKGGKLSDCIAANVTGFTWSGYTEPLCYRRHIDPRPKGARGYVFITAWYRGHAVWSA